MFVYELCRHIFTRDETLSCENRIDPTNYTNNHNADTTRNRQRTPATSSRAKSIKEYRGSSSSTEFPNTQTAPHNSQLHCAHMLPTRCHHGALGQQIAHTPWRRGSTWKQQLRTKSARPVLVRLRWVQRDARTTRNFQEIENTFLLSRIKFETFTNLSPHTSPYCCTAQKENCHVEGKIKLN